MSNNTNNILGPGHFQVGTTSTSGFGRFSLSVYRPKFLSQVLSQVFVPSFLSSRILLIILSFGRTKGGRTSLHWHIRGGTDIFTFAYKGGGRTHSMHTSRGSVIKLDAINYQGDSQTWCPSGRIQGFMEEGATSLSFKHSD